MQSNYRPSWQLPPGVSRGTWDYVTTPSIATEYDTFHGDHPLLRLDQKWIADRLAGLSSPADDPRLLIDLGCGTGRSLLPWIDRGWRTLGIDLSRDMLEQARSKCVGRCGAPGFLQANLAQLQCLGASVADAAVCLYSSIGMIRGAEHRHSMMTSVRRALKPDGLFFVHVHNRGAWLRDPSGVSLTLRSYAASFRPGPSEFGDRVYEYRGLPSMFLHIFSRRELIRALERAGLTVESVMVLNRTSSDSLRWRWWIPHLRAGGFLVTATKRSS